MLPDKKVQFSTTEAVVLATTLVSYQARNAGIRALVIKGPIAVKASLRDRRPSADVDVLVEPGKHSALVSMFESKGWIRRYDFPDHPKIMEPHSVTLIHEEWPCDLDIHSSWPGFFAKPKVAFDLLWRDHEINKLAGQLVETPNWRDHALIVALHSLRNPKSEPQAADLRLVIEALQKKAQLPGFLDGFIDTLIELGACETAAPLLSALGRADSIPKIRSKDFATWELFTRNSEVRGIAWGVKLRAAPLWQRPKIIWQALFPPLRSLETAHPELAGRPFWILRAWLRRLMRAAADLPKANRAIERANHEN